MNKNLPQWLKNRIARLSKFIGNKPGLLMLIMNNPGIFDDLLEFANQEVARSVKYNKKKNAETFRGNLFGSLN